MRNSNFKIATAGNMTDGKEQQFVAKFSCYSDVLIEQNHISCKKQINLYKINIVTVRNTAIGNGLVQFENGIQSKVSCRVLVYQYFYVGLYDEE